MKKKERESFWKIKSNNLSSFWSILEKEIGLILTPFRDKNLNIISIKKYQNRRKIMKKNQKMKRKNKIMKKIAQKNKSNHHIDLLMLKHLLKHRIAINLNLNLSQDILQLYQTILIQTKDKQDSHTYSKGNLDQSQLMKFPSFLLHIFEKQNQLEDLELRMKSMMK